MDQPDWIHILTWVLLSLASSLLISFLYLKFYSSRATGSLVHRAFPLVGVSITAIFIAIQFSLPLSLGLLGALSIVRFRTPVKEPEEVGFILLVVATSLACATAHLVLWGIILGVGLLGLFISRWHVISGRPSDGMFVVTLPGHEYGTKSEQLFSTLESLMPEGRLDSVSENEEESVVTYSFARLDRGVLLELQRQVREISSGATSNAFFRAG